MPNTIALNQELNDGARTANLFVDVAQTDHVAAERLYRVAEPFLIAVGRYDACGPFLDPPTRMRFAVDVYEIMKSMEEGRPEGENQPPKLARHFYLHNVATLVGLLALNHRAEEANRVREEAFTVLNDEEFRSLLDAALSGHLPPPQHD